MSVRVASLVATLKRLKKIMARLGDMKLYLLLAFWICLNCKNGALTEKSTCSPFKGCESKNLGTSVTNPDNSSQYFKCIEDVEGNKRPSDAVFSVTRNSYSSSSHYWRSRRDEKKCINICSGVCLHYLYERIADMKNCSVFYTCSPGNQEVKSVCPPEAPYYDGEFCQRDKKFCCSCCDQCMPYCYKANTQIADPFDCRSFYYCSSKKIPEQKDRYQCPEDKYFDNTKGCCVDENKLSLCSPLCRNETFSD